MLSQEIAARLLVGLARLRDELVHTNEPSPDRADLIAMESSRHALDAQDPPHAVATDSFAWYYAVDNLREPNERSN